MRVGRCLGFDGGYVLCDRYDLHDDVDDAHHGEGRFSGSHDGNQLGCELFPGDGTSQSDTKRCLHVETALRSAGGQDVEASHCSDDGFSHSGCQ